jgi:hypothetical protein
MARRRTAGGEAGGKGGLGGPAQVGATESAFSRMTGRGPAWPRLPKGLSFISNRQRRKEGTFCASELAGIEPTPPAPEEQAKPETAQPSGHWAAAPVRVRHCRVASSSCEGWLP